MPDRARRMVNLAVVLLGCAVCTYVSFLSPDQTGTEAAGGSGRWGTVVRLDLWLKACSAATVERWGPRTQGSAESLIGARTQQSCGK